MRTKKKHTLLTIVTLIALTCMFNACELETSGNGKLDGMWHLTSIDSIGAGNLDLSNQRIFWSFQAKLLELEDLDGQGTTCLMRFKRSNDSLTVSDPYINDRDEGDIALTDVTILWHYGLNGLQESFLIDKLSGGKMILSNSAVRLTFVKF